MKNVLEFIKRNPIQIILTVIPVMMALLLSHRNINHCPVQLWLHIPCPNCGMYRCFCSLLQGDIQMAIRYNVIPFIFIFAMFAWMLFKQFFRKHTLFTSVLLYLLIWGCLLGSVLNPFVYH